MKKIVKIILMIGIVVVAYVCGIMTTTENTEEIQSVITVDKVVEIMGTDYFIVKDINSWAVLNEDVYMDREVVEINICDDTENTLCLFIELDKNEKQHIRKVFDM